MDCKVFGVVNVTPDSFSDGGEYFDPDHAVEHGLSLVAAGAEVLDVGGEATSFHRPQIKPIAVQEQVQRVVPVIARLRGRTSCPISIDTRSAIVARAAIEAGAEIINDVSAGLDDPDMLPLAAQAGTELILMHRRMEPPGSTPHYENIVAEVGAFLQERVRAAREAGIPQDRLWIDPGLGFGKTVEHNVALLRAVSEFRRFGVRVLIGASRKRFIAQLGGEAEPRHRLGGSVAAALWAVKQGADGVRVHDVSATVAALRVWQALAGFS